MRAFIVTVLFLGLQGCGISPDPKVTATVTNQFNVYGVSPNEAASGEILTFTGNGFHSEVTIALGDGTPIEIQDITETSASFVAPEGKPGIVKVKITSGLETSVASFFRKGVIKQTNAADLIPDCSREGQVSCITNESFPAAATSGLAQKVPVLYEVAGVKGAYPVSEFGLCDQEGDSNCVVSANQVAIDQTMLNSEIIRENKSILGISGSYDGSAPYCESDGSTNCVANSSFPAINPASINPLDFVSALTIGGIRGRFQSCLINGESNCAIEPAGSLIAVNNGSLDSDNIKIGVQIGDVTGTYGVSDYPFCLGDDAIQCLIGGSFVAAEMSRLVPENIRIGSRVAGVTGVYNGIGEITWLSHDQETKYANTGESVELQFAIDLQPGASGSIALLENFDDEDCPPDGTNGSWSEHPDAIQVFGSGNHSFEVSYDSPTRRYYCLRFTDDTTGLEVKSRTARSTLVGVSSDWWSDRWIGRKKFTINTDSISADQFDIPLGIYLSGVDMSLVNTNGSDLRVIDGDGNALSYEIEGLNGSGVYLWFKVPLLRAGSDHDFYVYFGSPGVISQENAADVWSNGFLAVYHFDELSPNFTLVDSGPLGRHGQYVNPNSGTPNISQGIRSPQGSTAVRINVKAYGSPANVPYFDLGAFTIDSGDGYSASLNYVVSAFAGMDDISTSNTLFNKGHTANTDNHESSIVVNPDGSISGVTRAFQGGAGDINMSTNPGSVSNGTWNSIFLGRNATSSFLGVDGSIVSFDTSNPGGVWGDETIRTYIGATPDTGGASNYWRGEIDELRISNVARSADWARILHEVYFGNAVSSDNTEVLAP